MYKSPSREGLIVGSALVALHGLEQEIIATLRAHQVQNWNEHPRISQVRELYKKIRTGQPVTLDANCNMTSTLAHTQQTLRVCYEEWEEVLKITYE